MMYNYPFSSFPYFRRYSSNPSMYYGRTNFSSTKTYKNPLTFQRDITIITLIYILLKKSQKALILGIPPLMVLMVLAF